MMQDLWTVGVEEDPDPDEQAEALQRLVSGGAWAQPLEGSVGRSMMAALEAGIVVLGPTAQRDYWGNRIPSRYDVVDGSLGSISYANERREELGLDQLTEELVLQIEAGK